MVVSPTVMATLWLGGAGVAGLRHAHGVQCGPYPLRVNSQLVERVVYLALAVGEHCIEDVAGRHGGSASSFLAALERRSEGRGAHRGARCRAAEHLGQQVGDLAGAGSEQLVKARGRFLQLGVARRRRCARCRCNCALEL